MNAETVDILWIVIAAALVFLMQAGFMCLESGLTRAKNNINVAIKNITDFLFSYTLFWVVGFGMMFGPSSSGWIGLGHYFFPFESMTPWQTSFFFFQAMFAATSATILSGAMAERTRFASYIIISSLVSGLIYPVFGHWAWGGLFNGESGGWLQKMGFVDFAGSTVVHSVGGWVSLAALLLIGPRIGRFGEDGQVRRFTGSNVPLSVLGALLLFLGWFGFNGGSTLALNDQVPLIIANTALAAVVGGVATLGIGWMVRRRPDVELVINGTLAGLVAITANCHAVTAEEAAAIGALGGVVMLIVEALLEKLRIDDAVGAIPVHLGAGAWGTLAVGIFGDPQILATGLSWERQIGVQAIGIAAAGAWSFGVVLVLLFIINRFMPLRVQEEDEVHGLNVTEHGATTELLDLLTAMERQGHAGDLSMRVPVEPFTEVGQIASRYNLVMDMLQRAVSRAESVVRDIQDGIITFAENGTITSLNPGAEKLFGYRAEEAIGKPVNMLFDDNSQGPAMADASGLRLVTALRRDASSFACELRLARGEDSGAALYTGVVRDVSDRKAAQDALQASRDRISRQNRAMGELAVMATKTMSLDDRLYLIAKLAAHTLEVSRVSYWRAAREMESIDCTLCYCADGTPSVERATIDCLDMPAFRVAVQGQQLIATTQPGNDVRTRGLWAAHLSPARIHALLLAPVSLGHVLHGFLLFEHAQTPRLWHLEEEQFAVSMANQVVLAFEEDERQRASDMVRSLNRELEARVFQRTEELQRSNRELHDAMGALKRTQDHLVQTEKMAALGELVAGVAHEINTPVGVAVTAASHLAEKTRTLFDRYKSGEMKRSDLERFLEMTDESSQMLLANLGRAAQLVQSFKKVAVDQSSEARREFNVCSYIHEVLLSLRPKIKNTQHKVTVDCPGEVIINSYPGAFAQVITNLLMNAIIHAFEEHQAGHLHFKITLEGEEVVLIFSDDGCGISPENLRKIFDPFFTTKRGHGGSGLGLHLVYNIVTATLRGTIACSSNVGEGTQFVVRFPVEPEASSHH